MVECLISNQAPRVRPPAGEKVISILSSIKANRNKYYVSNMLKFQFLASEVIRK